MSQTYGGGQQMPSDGVTAKVQSALPDSASNAVQAVSDKAQAASGQVGQQARQQLDTRSTMAGEQLQAVGQALRSSGDDLRSQGKETPAKLISPMADRVEQVSQYLKTSDADRLLHDAEAYARRQPWTVAAGGIALGFLASRFLKASSSRRYQTQYPVAPQPSPSLTYEPYEVAGSRTGTTTSPAYAAAPAMSGSPSYEGYVTREPLAPGALSSGL